MNAMTRAQEQVLGAVEKAVRRAVARNRARGYSSIGLELVADEIAGIVNTSRRKRRIRGRKPSRTRATEER